MQGRRTEEPKRLANGWTDGGILFLSRTDRRTERVADRHGKRFLSASLSGPALNICASEGGGGVAGTTMKMSTNGILQQRERTGTKQENVRSSEQDKKSKMEQHTTAPSSIKLVRVHACVRVFVFGA
mmetsp:Transcript_39862/g.78591  ORF Transcript_39862/g.78591 Transcript_39862/m.78591 type:complete len:127 (+) Transcript_39862:272-652(+)